MDETVGFVGRDAELGKALDALSRGNNLLVKGKPPKGAKVAKDAPVKKARKEKKKDLSPASDQS